MADWIQRIIVRIHLHIVIAARVRVLDGCAWRRWRWSVRTVETTYIWYAWFATADVLDVIVGSYDEVDREQRVQSSLPNASVSCTRQLP